MDLKVSVATLADWQHAVAWANNEGWNIGYQDAACFHAADPDGFFIGRVGNRPVGAVSMVNHSATYSFWGNNLIDPEFRGHGFSHVLTRASRAHAGDRLVGADGMPHLADGYTRNHGLIGVHDTVHYIGRASGSVGEGAVRVGREHLDAIALYDSTAFPAQRRKFLSHWLFASGHEAYVRIVDGSITGYGVVRPAPLRHRIGPLVASTSEDASVLFDALTSDVDEVSVFAPEHGGAFLEGRGLKEEFRVLRMYTGAEPRVRAERVFATASLELG